MKSTTTLLLALTSLAYARPYPAAKIPVHTVLAREVPQEHSHNVFLDLVRTALALDNPNAISDPVFGLLGNAAAAGGAGKITNLDCLQQATADQAFTNALKANSLPGMAGALVYRALERNTGSVGLASVLCTEKAVNPQIDAIKQHQDPASDNAASINAGIAIELAKQLAGIGADPLLALEAGTFAPGTKGDPTAKGNSCDTENDEPGCIYSQKLLQLDVSEADISSAVAGIKATVTATGVISATDIDLKGLAAPTGAAAAITTAADAAEATDAAEADDECPAETTTEAEPAATSTCSVVTMTMAAAAAAATTPAASSSTNNNAASGTNVQTFTGTLGGPPPPVTSSTGDRPFTVNGNTFVNLAAALQRSCDIQNNACANAVNSGKLPGKSVSDCNAQQSLCNGGGKGAKRAASFGKCGSPTILFKAGLDGRTEEAFIAEDQTDYPHGSAQKIGIIAGFICQRLGDNSCGAAANVLASCTSASAAAVATTQNQAAADTFNKIIGAAGAGSGAVAAVTTAAPAVTATAAAGGKSVVMTVTQCS
jgi:hypothetical protein